MILEYSMFLNGKRSYFPEKIIKGLGTDPVTAEIANYIPTNDFDEEVFINCNPKLHTIRQDKSNRWKVGNKIHSVIYNRTPNRLQFVKTLTCICVQDIRIIPDGEDVPQGIVVDGRVLYIEEEVALIQNEGFDSTEDFWNYFDKGFTGKIIHWTNLMY